MYMHITIIYIYIYIHIYIYSTYINYVTCTAKSTTTSLCELFDSKSPGAVPMAALRGGRRGSHRESPPAPGAPSVYLRRAWGKGQ